MSKFMMIYHGEATDVSAMSEAEAAEVMAKWGSWMERVGPALVDVGSPFGPGTAVVDDGTLRDPVALSGYSIVEADDLDAARGLTAGHPYLTEGKGDYSVEVFELMPVPFQHD